MFNKKILLILFTLSSYSLHAATPHKKKSWARKVRDVLKPVLSERNHQNWDNLIASVEQNPDEQLVQTAQNGAPTSKAVAVCTFKDVAGGVPDEILSVLDMINNAEHYRRYGVNPAKGILLVGPPGCGKTLLARAIAGEAGCPFIYASATEFIEVYVGTGPARVRELFAMAKQANALTGRKAIIFIDEMDAIGSREAMQGGDTESRRTLNELLNQMDGFAQNNDIFVLAATNNPQDLDTAIKRPGRFDTIVEIPLPDQSRREAVIRHYANKIPNNVLDQAINYEKLAIASKNFNNAELKEMVREASLGAARTNAAVVTQAHFDQALAKTKKRKQF